MYPLNLEVHQNENYKLHTCQWYTCHHTCGSDLHGVSLHLLPRLPPSLLPVKRIQMAEDVCCGWGEDALGISGDGLFNDVTQTMQRLRGHLKY